MNEHACVQLKPKLPIHDQITQSFQKHDEFLNYKQNMNMHVVNFMERPQNSLENVNMHARFKP